MEQPFESIVSSSHPALPGHFPHKAVVPAVVILDQVRGAMRAWNESRRMNGISYAKFTAVLLPDETFTITLVGTDLERISFDCRKADGTRFANGEILTTTSGQ
jgi:3-hydroxymyristoyl/3-hydroxydecanoyl-(acyl carrier protein) dehydratase